LRGEAELEFELAASWEDGDLVDTERQFKVKAGFDGFQEFAEAEDNTFRFGADGEEKGAYACDDEYAGDGGEHGFKGNDAKEIPYRVRGIAVNVAHWGKVSVRECFARAVGTGLVFEGEGGFGAKTNAPETEWSPGRLGIRGKAC